MFSVIFIAYKKAFLFFLQKHKFDEKLYLEPLSLMKTRLTLERCPMHQFVYNTSN